MGQKKRWVAGIFSVVLLAAFIRPAGAEVTLDEVLQRLEKLEQANIRLEAENMTLKSQVAALENKPVPVAATPTVAAAAPTSGNFLKTKMDIELYGQVKADAVYTSGQGADTATASTTSLYNAPRRTGEDHSEFNIAGHDTRLGLKLNPVALDNGGKVSGKIEMDFAGELALTKYNPRVRLAYVTLDYDKWSLVAGQAWDFFVPLNTSILNTSVLFRGGNLGARHPMAYAESRFALLGGKLKTQIGAIDGDAGAIQDSGYPIGAAYVEYSHDVFGKPLTVGSGGVYGKTYGLPIGKTGSTDPRVWAVTVNAVLKMADWLTLKGEGYHGADLSVFMSGDTGNAGIYTYANNVKSVVSQGGFVELTYKPVKNVETNYGVGFDGMDDSNVNGLVSGKTTAWDVNRTYYTNVKYNLSKDLCVGLEYQRLYTHYTDDVKGAESRIQSSVTQKF